MHSCSNEFILKISKPAMSRMPMKDALVRIFLLKIQPLKLHIQFHRLSYFFNYTIKTAFCEIQVNNCSEYISLNQIFTSLFNCHDTKCFKTDINVTIFIYFVATKIHIFFTILEQETDAHMVETNIKFKIFICNKIPLTVFIKGLEVVHKMYIRNFFHTRKTIGHW
jgi:hypothetical protein